MRGSFITLVILSAMSFASLARAGEADVVDAFAWREAKGTWRFDVSVRHADEGWEHYADQWEILSPDGTLLATRVLYHPHVTEQPFTRSLTGVTLPESIDRVVIRARDSVHEYGGKELEIELRR